MVGHDARRRMSGFGRKADGISERAEGRQMSQSVNRKFLGLDRFGLVSPPYPGLETRHFPGRSPIIGQHSRGLKEKGGTCGVIHGVVSDDSYRHPPRRPKINPTPRRRD